MPYGMSVVYAFLKEYSVPVSQYDFLMEYLFASPEDIDYHNPDRSFSEEEFFSFLERQDHHARLAHFTRKYGDRLPSDAGVYAFSIVAYHQFWAALLIGRYLKTVNPAAVIVFGGPFITIKPAPFLVRYGIADYWIKGSGEIPLLMLYQQLRDENGPPLESIPGLVFLQGDQIIAASQSRLPAEEERPPDFEGLDLDAYRYDHDLIGRETLFLPYRTTKGCPGQCSFCTGRLVDRFDAKSVEKVVGELQALSRAYDTPAFQFADASVNGNPARLGQLCDRLVTDFPDIRWYSYAKIDGFTSELLRKVKAAGCFSLFWGVESAHEPTLRLLGKRFKVDRMYELIDRAVDLGVKNYVHLIYHTPHESREDVEAFIALVERYIESDLVLFLPQRFLLESQSHMFDHAEQYGLTDVTKVDRGVFEREEYVYGETEGLDFQQVRQRNEANRRLLEGHLEWIRCRNLFHGLQSGPAHRLSARLLVATARHSRRFSAIRKIHNRLAQWIESGSPSFREQL